MVTLPEGSMKSRDGNSVPIKELINNMEDTIKESYLNQHKGEWGEEESNNTAT